MSSPTGDTYIYAVKSSGPSTDPWGTSDVHGVVIYVYTVSQKTGDW